MNKKLILIKVCFTAETEIAIVDPSAADAIDRPVIRNNRGEPYIPVTSIAGALRAHLGEDANSIMGSIDCDNDVSESSRLQLVGAKLITNDKRIKMRTQTAIDRVRAAARSQTLRVSEVLEAGVRVELYAVYHGGGCPTLMAKLASWVPVLGGNKTTGMGRCVLTQLSYRNLDLSHNKEDITDWLNLGGEALFNTTQMKSVNLKVEAPNPLCSYKYRIVDALLIDSCQTTVDGTQQKITESSKTIKGSTIKGVFKSQVEFILQSLEIEEKICDRIITNIFGSMEKIGALIFNDAEIDNPDFEVRYHVSIDRLTGGASNGLLFASQPIVSGTFIIKIDQIRELLDDEYKYLELVMRDFDDGYLGIGSRTSRGCGTIQRLLPEPEPEPESVEV